MPSLPSGSALLQTPTSSCLPLNNPPPLRPTAGAPLVGETLPVLNPENLEELCAALPMESVAGLITLFLHDAESQFRGISACEKAGDLAGIARHAHMIVSSAGNLGAMRTSALAREVEQCCKAGDPSCVASLLEELRQTAAQSSTALQAWRDSKNNAVLASA